MKYLFIIYLLLTNINSNNTNLYSKYETTVVHFIDNIKNESYNLINLLYKSLYNYYNNININNKYTNNLSIDYIPFTLPKYFL